MIDKKAKRLFLKYMENKSSLNLEEIEYIKEKGLLREDIVITEKEFIDNLLLLEFFSPYLKIQINRNKV